MYCTSILNNLWSFVSLSFVWISNWFFSEQDDEFVIRDTLVDVDDEHTLEEEEKLEADEDHEQEISALAEEGKCTSTSFEK